MIKVGLRQLEQFIAVAEELNFRRAAQRLHMSQPPLTQAIQRLERATGVLLLERNRSSVRLTAAGAVLLDEARRIGALTKSAIAATRQAADGERGVLRLSFVASAGLGLMPSVVQAFRRRHPDVRIELRSETTTMQIESLRAHRIDAGILVPPLRDAPEIAVAALWRERLVAAVPADHPCADAKAIDLARLAEDPFVLFPLSQGPAFLGAILNACLGAGFSPRVVQEAPQLQTVVALVACGLGVSIVPEAMRAIRHERVRFIALNDRPAPAYELAISHWRDSPNPVIAHFLQIAREAASGQARAACAHDPDAAQVPAARLSRRASHAPRYPSASR